MTEETKECPYCAETVKAKAIICRYCRQPIVEGLTRESLLAMMSRGDKVGGDKVGQDKVGGDKAGRDIIKGDTITFGKALRDEHAQLLD